MKFWIVLGFISALVLALEAKSLNTEERYEDDYVDWNEVQEIIEQEKNLPQPNVVTSVCYGDLGCFYSNWSSSLTHGLPESPEVVGTKFYLYTADSGDKNYTLTRNDSSLLDLSDFNPLKDVKFIVHGFASHVKRKWIGELRKALINEGEHNVIAVDWSNGARKPYYLNSIRNMQVVAREITVLSELIRDNYGKKDYSDLHVIGHSLGAHVGGLVGERMMETKNMPLSRISALDPAGPLLEHKDVRVRLDESDAKFVDVIHTNGDPLYLGGAGSASKFGHVDFYPNGGKTQPGCYRPAIAVFKGEDPLCNHRRAIWYYINSINDKCIFTSFTCPGGYNAFEKGNCFSCSKDGQGKPCGKMGYYAKAVNVTGNQYLMTRAVSPFCGRQMLLEVKVSKGQWPKYGILYVTLYGKNGTSDQVAFNRQEQDDDFWPGSVYKHVKDVNPEVFDLEKATVKFVHHYGFFKTLYRSIDLDSIKFTLTNQFTLSLLSKTLKGISSKVIDLKLP